MRLDHKNGIYIRRIKVRNFKSFKNLDITLNDLNVIIGANASGKSNFMQVFNFLKDITTHGLNDAISIQGGLKYLLNFTQSDKTMQFEITLETNDPVLIHLPISSISRPHLLKMVYSFEIKLTKSKYRITHDKISIDFLATNHDDKEAPEITQNFVLEKGPKGRKMAVTSKQTQQPKFKIDRIFKRFIDEKKRLLILEDSTIIHSMLYPVGDFFDMINVYDFDPKIAKNASPIKGITKLKSDGSNLAAVLKNVLSDKTKKQSFSNLMIDFLPFIDSVHTENVLDRSIISTFKERYFKQRPLPSTLISDGTVDITAIILALYFQQNTLAAFEEPERNIHPSLMLKLVDTLKDASCLSQIVVTTHNPEFIRHVPINNIFTVRRDSNGDSKIIKPAELDEVKSFLKDDIGAEYLFVQNLLGD